MVATCFSRLPALKVLTICSGRLYMYLDLFYELSTFISNCWILDPLGSKRIRREYHNFESIIAYYTKCIYGREENTSCEISTVHVVQGLLLILIQRAVLIWLFWHFNAYIWRCWCKTFKPTWIPKSIWFDRILTVNGVYIYTSRESYGQLISGQAFRVHIHLNAWTTHLMICLKNVNKSYNK